MDRTRLEELLNMYYHYESGLMRQIVGRQLSRGLRKDLDELESDENSELKSRRRQVRREASGGNRQMRDAVPISLKTPQTPRPRAV
jgi:hypothetical protein